MSAVRARQGDAGADEFARSQRAAKFILSKTKLRPKIALVLGSGFGAFADELASATRIPYGKIPRLPASSTVEGHAGRLVIGKVSDVPVAVDAGPRAFLRRILAEGSRLSHARVAGRWEFSAAILTNAAGAINLDFKPGRAGRHSRPHQSAGHRIR